MKAMKCDEIICPLCNGLGTLDCEDRHTDLGTDICKRCGGTGVVKLETGKTEEASFKNEPSKMLSQGLPSLNTVEIVPNYPGAAELKLLFDAAYDAEDGTLSKKGDDLLEAFYIVQRLLRKGKL